MGLLRCYMKLKTNFDYLLKCNAELCVFVLLLEILLKYRLLYTFIAFF